MTLERFSGDVPSDIFAVIRIVANTPGDETVTPGVVIAPVTPVIVPAALSIMPGLKYVLAPS